MGSKLFAIQANSQGESAMRSKYEQILYFTKEGRRARRAI